MKSVLTGALSIISYLGIFVSAIWALVEFILYLVKDKPFNWTSVWMILICAGATVVSFILSAIFAVTERNKSVKRFESKTKSRWQERLEEMQSKRG